MYILKTDDLFGNIEYTSSTSSNSQSQIKCTIFNSRFVSKLRTGIIIDSKAYIHIPYSFCVIRSITSYFQYT